MAHSVQAPPRPGLETMRALRWFGKRRLVPLVFLSISCNLMAGELGELSIRDNDGIYTVRLEMRVDVPAHYIYQVLTDYRHIYRLNSSITASEVITDSTAGPPRVRTVIEDCIVIRCLKIARTETVYAEGDMHLHVVTDPEVSDFKSGITDWWVLPDGNGSKVIYRAEMEPDFYVPPIIGPFVMRSELRNGILKSLENLECIARDNAGLITSNYHLRDGTSYLEENVCGR